jgi:hypothetical protein
MERRLFFFLLLGNSRSILVRDLTLHPHKVGNVSSRITEGRNKELIPKGRSIDPVIQQAHRHVVALFNGLANALNMFRIRFGSLQEAAVAAQNLVQRISRQVEKALTGVHNGVVGERRVGDHKVLLGSLQSLDEGKVRIVEDLIGNALRARQQSIDGHVLLLLQNGCGLVVAQVRSDGGLELFVLFFEEGHRLLQLGGGVKDFTRQPKEPQ